MSTLMVDGINLDVRAIRARWGTSTPVMIPIDGRYAWSPAQEAEFPHKIHYSVLARDNEWAAGHARTKDIEARWRTGGDAGPADVAPFLAARATISDDATIYCSLWTAGGIPEPVRAQVPRWHLAWYWGRPTSPGRADVLAELERVSGVVIEPARLWACQFASYQQWDVSVIYGTPDWSR